MCCFTFGLGFVVGALADVGYHWLRDPDNRDWLYEKTKEILKLKG